MPRRQSTFKTPAGEHAYLAAYEAALDLWPVPHRSRHVPTRWGATHVLVTGPQDAPPLILLHGMNLSATMWYANVAPWSERYRVYAVDTIGSAGQSVAARPLVRRADCAAWLDDLLDGLAIERAHLVGHSHGGWLATNYALRAPQRIRRLVLLAPAGTLRPLVSAFWLRGMPILLSPKRERIVGFMDWMTVGDFFPDERFVEQFVLGMQHVRSRIWAYPTAFAGSALRRLAPRTLLLIGAQEVICNPHAAIARARRLIPAVDAEIVPRASHGLPLERPDRVNERVLSFLDRG
jgi:pimeloyl-ACP methyl ester carboxylesterase